MGMSALEIKFGGLNNKDADFDVLDNQATDILNMVFVGNDAVKTRDGYAQYGDTVTGSKKCVGLGKYIYSDGTGNITRSLYSVFGTDIYKDVAGTWTAQSRTLTDSTDGQFVQANNELYYFNGTDAVQNLNNTTWSSLASGAPMSGANNIGRYARYKGGMLFVAGLDSAPSDVYVSGDADGSLDTPEDFTGGWIYSVGKNDGSGLITGLEVLGDYIVVLKERAIYLMTGVTGDTQSIIQKVDGIGCIAPKSIATDGRVVFFQSFDGHVYGFDGNVAWKLSDVIQTTIREDLNRSAMDLSAGVYNSENNIYILSVVKTAASVPAMQLVLDLDLTIIQTQNKDARTWTVFETPPANVWIEFEEDGSESPAVLFGDSGGTGKVFTMFSGTNDDSSGIESYYVTKNFSMGEPQRSKVFHHFYSDVEQTGAWDLDVFYSVNSSDFTGTTPDTLDLTPKGAVLPFTLPVVIEDAFLVTDNMVQTPTGGRYIRLKWGIDGVTADEYFTLYAGTLYFRYSKRRLRRA